jgi:hypothetical protein
MKQILTILLILLIWLPIHSQKVLLGKKVPETFEPGLWGPNLRHYGHLFGSMSILSGKSKDESLMNPVLSHALDIGYRYKFKIFNYYALGADITASAYSYRLIAGNPVPGVVDKLMEKEKFRFTTTGISFFQRINFDRRGNFIGKYLDLGVFANYIFYSKHIYTYIPEDELVGKIKVTEKHLTYLNDGFYGVFGRLGTNNLALIFKYRVSDIFGSSRQEFTPYQIGLEVSIIN